MQGGAFGAAVDAKNNAWLSSYRGRSIALFDRNGKPLTPAEGITFSGRLWLMQGIIVTPSADVWAAPGASRRISSSTSPKGDPNNGRIVCEGREVEPCKSFLLPFNLVIDPQERI